MFPPWPSRPRAIAPSHYHVSDVQTHFLPLHLCHTRFFSTFHPPPRLHPPRPITSSNPVFCARYRHSNSGKHLLHEMLLLNALQHTRSFKKCEINSLLGLNEVLRWWLPLCHRVCDCAVRRLRECGGGSIHQCGVELHVCAPSWPLLSFPLSQTGGRSGN